MDVCVCFVQGCVRMNQDVNLLAKNIVQKTNLKQTLGHLKGLHFLPLGGCGEIGMNANLYACDGQWLMIDNGITFSKSPDSVLMTDIRAFLEAVDLKTLQGLVITHAHEDHVGAAAYLWPYLRCPIYATPFTAYILRHKLKDWNIHKAQVIEVPLENGIQLGNFSVEFVSLTHSIPEPSALYIRTAHGNIFHTGDWKIDPDPLIGPKIEAERLTRIGDEGVLALVCDSTNVFEEGVAGSEGDVRVALKQVIAECDNRVLISCFSSNLARIQSCYEAAEASNRKVCLVGRSLQRMVDAARHCGYWPPERTFIEPHDIPNYPPHQILVITTGSQAEPSAALTRMSMGTHPAISLTENDTVIFSSRVIPGNQDAISALQNRLIRKGVTLIKYREGLHVSGHPCQDELAQMYTWLRPRIVIPVHGEDIHIHGQARFAESRGVPHTLRPHNGQLYCLSDQQPFFVCDVPTGRLALDGKRLVEDQGPVITQRRELLSRGFLTVTLIISKDHKKILDQRIQSYGVFEYPEEQRTMEDRLRRTAIETFCDHWKDDQNGGAPLPTKNNRKLNIAIEHALRRTFKKEWGMQPVVYATSVWV